MIKTLWITIRNAYAQRVQVRLIVYFLLILIPLVGVSLFANFRSTDILEHQISERTKNSLQSTLDYIDLTLEDLDKLSVLIATDYSISPVLYEANAILLPTNLLGFYTVMKRLSNIAEIHGSLEEISILHADSGTLISSGYGGRKIVPQEHAWFTEVVHANGKMVLYIADEHSTNSVFGANTVSFMRLMELNDRERKANILILTMGQEKLQGLIQNVLPTSNSAVYLFSGEGELIAGSSENVPLPSLLTSASDETTLTDDGNLLWRTHSEKSGWSLALVQPEKELYRQSSVVQTFTYAIIVISVLLALLTSLVVYKSIAAPLTKLLYGMKQMRLGKYSTRLPSDSKDQFGTLTDAFNQMISEQQMLIQNVYEHQLQLSHTELKFLQSQINPHFLYNTLDSIYWTAKNYDAEEISDMVLNLSRFFRLSLSKGSETFTVEETVEHLQYYLRVQQFRLLGELEVEYDISESSKHVRVLKLLLQPVVENAILHGLEKKGGGGKLTIASKIDDDALYLSVTDDGAGIGEDRLEFIRSELAQLNPNEAYRSERTRELFGLRNVIGRMQLYYGPEAGLHIDSKENAGTTVTLRIPLEATGEKSSNYQNTSSPSTMTPGHAPVQ